MSARDASGNGQGRWQFIPPWQLTRWGLLLNNGMWSALRWQRACDEFHNPSHFFILPFVGQFVLFDRGYDVSGPVHLHGRSNGVWLGADVPGCFICEQIKEEIDA